MKRYDKYKPSGIDWIGEVPEHWDVMQLRRIAKVFTGSTPPTNRADYYDSEDILWYTPSDFTYDTYKLGGSERKMSYKAAKEFVGELFPKNTILMTGIGLVGKIGIAPEDCYSNQQINAIVVNKNHSFEYVAYYLKGIKDVILSLPKASLLPILNQSETKQIAIVVPPLIEQEAIAAYLDARCADIDKVVATQQKRIALLQELKQSEITQAVTRGLNPDARMKNSGVEWIGMVPEHWEVKKLKFVSNSISKGAGITKEQVVEDGDTQCVRYGEIYTKYNHSFDSCVSATNKDLHPVLQYFGYGDILFTCTGELVEEIGKSVVYLGHERCLAGGDILVVSHNQDPSFLNYALNSYAQIQKSEGRAKLKVVHISTYDISNLLLALPPIEEQKQIADEIDRRCSSIDKQIGAVTRQIELLREYKQSLITDVVTGKRKVC